MWCVFKKLQNLIKETYWSCGDNSYPLLHHWVQNVISINRFDGLLPEYFSPYSRNGLARASSFGIKSLMVPERSSNGTIFGIHRRTICKWLIGQFEHIRVSVQGASEHFAFYQHDEI